jgi:hypothetical protein
MVIKGKFIPVKGNGGPRGHETSRLPHFEVNRLTDGGDITIAYRGLRLHLLLLAALESVLELVSRFPALPEIPLGGSIVQCILLFHQV